MPSKRDILVILTILAILSSPFVFAYTRRPIVDYYMSGVPNTANFQFGPLRLILEYRNRGVTDAPLHLIVTSTNANITVDTSVTLISGNESSKIVLEAFAFSNTETYEEAPINVRPAGNPQNFSVVFSVKVIGSGGIDGFVQSFASLNAFNVINATYIMSSQETYTLKT